MARAENGKLQTLCSKSVFMRRVNLVLPFAKRRDWFQKGTDSRTGVTFWSVLDAKSH
jgi:hypothetical protein